MTAAALLPGVAPQARCCPAGLRTWGAPCAGLDHQWGLELYGKLLETGGGKERMTAYFTVRSHQSTPLGPIPRAKRTHRHYLPPSARTGILYRRRSL